jgi:hypothetical protein
MQRLGRVADVPNADAIDRLVREKGVQDALSPSKIVFYSSRAADARGTKEL